MDFSEVRKLVKLVEASEIQEIEFERDGAKIRISKAESAPEVQAIPMQMPAPAAAPLPQMPQPALDAAASASPPLQEAKPNYHEVKSPMVGTFYKAPAPDADPYVAPGDQVKPGQTLCIIEAMKLMNEIESDISGRVVEICVDNEQPVEYGQVLFKVDTNG